MESTVLNSLNFDITIFTVKHFTGYLVNLLTEENIIAPASVKFLDNIANYLAELCLTGYKFITYRPSLVAASIVSLSLRLLGVSPWTHSLERETCYEVENLTDCVNQIYALWKNVAHSPLQAAVTKYSQTKYQSVSTKVF